MRKQNKPIPPCPRYKSLNVVYGPFTSTGISFDYKCLDCETQFIEYRKDK